MHGRVRVSSVCTAECARVERMHERVHGRVLGRMSGRVHVSGVCAAPLFMAHDTGECAAQLVGTRPRFGRDARIGCTRAKLYGYD